MSIETNKRIVRDFFDALSDANVQAIVDAYTPDATCWTSGTLPFSGRNGMEQIVQNANGVLGLFPDKLKFTITAMTAEGDRVAVEAESYGKHVNGKVYNNQYHFLFVLRDGKVHELKEYMDTMHANEVLCQG